MRGIVLVPLFAAAFLFADSSAIACDRCGAHGARCGCCATCEPATCGAPCQPVEYEKRKITVYEVSFREIAEEKIKVSRTVEDRIPRTIVCRVPKTPPCQAECGCN